MATSAKQQYISSYMRLHPDATRNSAEYHWRVSSARAQGRTKQQLRGHGRTPEHGGVLRGTPRRMHLPGRDISRSYSDRTAERAINHAADNENRVQLQVHTPKGGWQTIGGSRGYSGGYVAGQVGKSGGLRDALKNGAIAGVGKGDKYDVGADEVDDIDAWQVSELV